MKFTLKIILAIFLLSQPLFGQSTRVIGYVPTWGNFTNFTNTLDYSKVSHLNLAFANPNGTGDLEEGLSDNALNAFITKAHAEGVQVLISLGGATAPAAWDTLMNTTYRTGFISKIMNYVSTYNFDGIDMDLEGSKITSNYAGFVTELAVKTRAEGVLLTAAVASWNGYAITDQALGVFDFINLMAYDATGPWNPSNAGPHSSMSFAQSDLNYWTSRGVAPENCVLGVPFYGYDFSRNGLGVTYNQILSQYGDSAAYLDQVGQVYYNGKNTMGAKTVLGIENYGGIMIWELTQDRNDQHSLLDTIYQTIQSKNYSIGENNRPPNVSISEPLSGSLAPHGFDVRLAATAWDIDGSIAQVYFVLNNDTVAQFSGSGPYEFLASNLSVGNYTFYALAVDDSAAVRPSLAVTFEVERSSPEIFLSNVLALDTFSINVTSDLFLNFSDSLFSLSDAWLIIDGDTLFQGAQLGNHTVSYLPTTPGLKMIKVQATNVGGGVAELFLPIYINEPTAPFDGNAMALPGTVEAEHYDKGGYLSSYYDKDTANRGGASLRNDMVDVEEYGNGKYNLGYLSAGEWTKYTVQVSSADTFQVYAALASAKTGGAFELYINGSLAMSTTGIQSSGGWSNFKERSCGFLYLDSGQHELTFKVTAEEFNVDYLRFEDALNPSTAETIGAALTKVYPNPARGTLNVEGINGTFDFSMMDLNGKECLSGFSTGILDLNSLPQGTYFVTIRQNNLIQTHRFIKLE